MTVAHHTLVTTYTAPFRTVFNGNNVNMFPLLRLNCEPFLTQQVKREGELKSICPLSRKTPHFQHKEHSPLKDNNLTTLD